MPFRFGLILLCLTAHAADLRVDHVTVAGQRLETIEAQLATAGLSAEMARASFPDGSYLELVAGPAGAIAGPSAWAVRAANGKDGDGKLLPLLMRDAARRGKSTNRGYMGVLRVVIAVPKLSDAVERFTQAYPMGKPLKEIDRQFGAEIAWFTDSPVVLAAPLSANSWIGQRISLFGEGPCALVLATRKTPKRDFAAHSRWFGRDVDWFDAEKLGGWWLGVEQQ